jgi:hypothetical protein
VEIAWSVVTKLDPYEVLIESTELLFRLFCTYPLPANHELNQGVDDIFTISAMNGLIDTDRVLGESSDETGVLRGLEFSILEGFFYQPLGASMYSVS